MVANRARKRAVRERMQVTDEAYTEALRKLTPSERRAVQNDLDQVARSGEGYERWERADGRYAGARKTSRLPQLLPPKP